MKGLAFAYHVAPHSLVGNIMVIQNLREVRLTIGVVDDWSER
jgi:hypothetical protein